MKMFFYCCKEIQLKLILNSEILTICYPMEELIEDKFNTPLAALQKLLI